MELIRKEFRNKKGFVSFSISSSAKNSSVKNAKIEMLAVYPEYRNSGQGSKFLKRTISFIENFDADIEKIILTAVSFHNDKGEQNAIPQDSLVKFYESFGFKRVPTKEKFIVPMEKIL